MGLIQKKDQKRDQDGIEVIERGAGPDGLDKNETEIVEGESAEHIAAGTTAAKEAAKAEAQMVADADDEALKEGIEDEKADDDADEADDDEGSEADADDSGHDGDHNPFLSGGSSDPARRNLTIAIVVAIVLVIVAGIGGYFIGHGGFGQQGTGTATLSKDQLDTTIASYSYNGANVDVTARQAIESQYSLDTVKDSDGNYAAPSAEAVVSYVRNQILLKEAESRGISVSDKEMKSFAKEKIGSDDYKQIAQSYSMSEDQAKQVVRENTILQKLYGQIVPDSTSSTQPTEPTAPADGNEATASKEYADYIIKLAGKEWDSSKGTWAKEDGPYYQALKDEKFTADSATYKQAQMAYYVAYQQYATSSQQTSSKWTKFANGLYAKADVKLYGLYVQ